MPMISKVPVETGIITSENIQCNTLKLETLNFQATVNRSKQSAYTKLFSKQVLVREDKTTSNHECQEECGLKYVLILWYWVGWFRGGREGVTNYNKVHSLRILYWRRIFQISFLASPTCVVRRNCVTKIHTSLSVHVCKYMHVLVCVCARVCVIRGLVLYFFITVSML